MTKLTMDTTTEKTIPMELAAELAAVVEDSGDIDIVLVFLYKKRLPAAFFQLMEKNGFVWADLYQDPDRLHFVYSFKSFTGRMNWKRGKHAVIDLDERL